MMERRAPPTQAQSVQEAPQTDQTKEMEPFIFSLTTQLPYFTIEGAARIG
jgi:hypothetical protein